jgi:threonine synthase
LLADGFVAGDATIVLFLTASGYKYLEVLEALASTPRN